MSKEVNNSANTRTRGKLSWLLLSSAFTFLIGCGDAGIGLNITKAVPVEIPVEIVLPDRSDTDAITDLLEINPPARTLVYDISEIEAFESALDGIQGSDNIVINSLAYRFSGISEGEEADMDSMVIRLSTPGANLDLLNVRRRLQNIDRTPISITDEEREAIAIALSNAEAVTADVTFDLAELPETADSISFDYALIFDITIRARDL